MNASGGGGGVSRRRLLRGGIAGIGAGIAGGMGIPDAWASPAGRLPDPTGALGTGAAGEELIDLPVVNSRSGLLEHTLTVAGGHPVVGGRRLGLDIYNGRLPGELWRVRAGDRVRVLLRNCMEPSGVPPVCTQDDASGCLPARERQTLVHDAVTTNLHVHGLQVSPSGSSDNMYVSVPPGGSRQYVYDIPSDQPSGLYWYHPHHHGSTTHQGWSGLCGPLVVEGAVDRVPEIADMRERVIVINALRLDVNGENPTVSIFPTAGDEPFTRDDPFTTDPVVPARMMFPLNGGLRPVVTIRPGEVQRWRVLNAAPHREMWLHVDGHTLYWIGQDGIPFACPRQVPSLLLAPGNRAEFLIRGGEPGRHCIYAAPYRQGPARTDRPALELGTLEVCGPQGSGCIPQRLVDPPRMPRLPIARRRTLVITREPSEVPGGGARFLINGEPFDMDRIDQEVEAGTVEEWRFVNRDDFQHPMHIHVNPFQVADIKGIPEGDTSWQTDPTLWWDTYRLPPGGEVTLRMYFRPDATGKTVFHCHVLPHEDSGTMGTLLISPPGGRGRASTGA
ncbi:multicopper oxidase family protein [Streptomyces sp. ET3-23]|uniref:multicopper oxidase family protein n=1 Tax=Streptomyces sp. ET3-23 TaxID=2885643 RepID=UPI001D100547|nr:multicopper oxidase family protein [Streptomyces sp. ET3-23]MCC2280297.1 multicopper oxidase family protein [Streptomyces sp. ET3-23]